MSKDGTTKDVSYARNTESGCKTKPKLTGKKQLSSQKSYKKNLTSMLMLREDLHCSSPVLEQIKTGHKFYTKKKTIG